MVSLKKRPTLDPASTLILVTGASGYIASNIVREALELGYRVRGTARSQDKVDSTVRVQSHVNYQAVIVSDFSKPGPEIDAAVKGVTAICHVASDTTFGEDAGKVIGMVVDGINAFLEAASKEASVKRFVYTSSSTAALTPKPNVEQTATAETWNDEIVDYAWSHHGESFGPNPYGFVVYAASKTEGEKAFWKFVKEKRPGFVANAVLPNFNIGRILKGGSGGVTASAIVDLYEKGERLPLPPQYFVDVVDDARLHLIAAVLDGKLENERIFAFATPFSCNLIIDLIQKIRPGWEKAPNKDSTEGEDLSKVPNDHGAELLTKWFGQDGYQTLEESLKQNLIDV